MNGSKWKTLLAQASVMLAAAMLVSACSGGEVPNNGSRNTDSAASGGADNGKATPSAGNASIGNEKATLTVSTFWPDPMLEWAKKKYEQMHPNITIEVHSVTADDSQIEAELEKYVTATNTAVLSGNGPDLLFLDMLPADKYVGQHLLEDLGPWLRQESSFKNGDYFNNILENSQTGGGLYSVPLSFFLNAMFGNEPAIKQTGVPVDDSAWTWDSFLDTAQQLTAAQPGKQAIGITPTGLLGQLAKENSSRFIDTENRKAFFDTAGFTDSLELVKAMSDKQYIGTARDAFLTIKHVTSAWDYLNTLQESGQGSRMYAMPHSADTGEGGFFYTYRTVGMNAKSSHKDIAKDFLLLLMSDQFELSAKTAGFPINKKLYEKQAEQLMKAGATDSYQEGPLGGATFPVDTKALEDLEAYLKQAAHGSPFQQGMIEELVMKESQAFFAGQKSAQSVAKLIQNKAMTYLNE